MSIFAQPSGASIFGQNNVNQQNGSSFGPTNTNQNRPNLFGSLNTATAPLQPAQSSSLFGSLNGSTAASQPQQGGALFGATSGPQTASGLFGSSKPPQQGTFFAPTQSQHQQSHQGGGQSNLGTFGSLNAQHGQTQQPQQQQASGLFGGFGQSTQQINQQNLQPGIVLGDPQSQSRLLQQSNMVPRRRPVIEQIELVFAKWHPESPNTLFQTYLYNSVPPESAPFYGPTALDDETKWEEALSRKPSAGAIPVLVKGFEQIASRMETQNRHLQTLRGRLHEINEGLNSLLQKHDLQISVRAGECRKKHLKLSRRCLGLAAKTQILKNRGYAMDSSEEELRKRLLVLERAVCDLALNGRGEEIWARMVSIRERGRQLQREFDRAGTTIGEFQEGAIDQTVVQRARKILDDYHAQLQQLAKELAQVQRDWTEWEQSKPFAITNGSRQD